MKIISLKQSSGGVYQAELSDDSSLFLRSEYLPQNILNDLFNLDEGELNPAVEEGLRFAAECFRAEKPALRLIARAEQCSAGLSRKLEKRKISAKCAGAVISKLIEAGLIDDERYARYGLSPA